MLKFFKKYNFESKYFNFKIIFVKIYLKSYNVIFINSSIF